MTESVFSKKVTWFSFVYSILVIWVHSYNAQLYLGETRCGALVGAWEYAVIDWVAQIAVPGFFMLSGYLFYRNFDMSKLRQKWENRIRSVLIPYILWNFLYYMGYVIGSRIPWMDEVVGKGVIPFQLETMTDAIINHTYNYVFWYLYQLIFLILLAPILYFILTNTWRRCLFFAWLGVILFLDLRLPILNADAFFYYSAAASAALTNPSLIEQDEPTKKSGKAGRILIVFGVVSYGLGLRYGIPIGFVLCRFLGVTGLWLMVSGKKLPEVKSFMKNNFFLYAIHFGIVRFLNKAFAQVFSGIWAVPVLLFIGMPILVLGISTAAANIMKRWTPRMWKIFSGGR